MVQPPPSLPHAHPQPCGGSRGRRAGTAAEQSASRGLHHRSQGGTGWGRTGQQSCLPARSSLPSAPPNSPSLAFFFLARVPPSLPRNDSSFFILCGRSAGERSGAADMETPRSRPQPRAAGESPCRAHSSGGRPGVTAPCHGREVRGRRGRDEARTPPGAGTETIPSSHPEHHLCPPPGHLVPGKGGKTTLPMVLPQLEQGGVLAKMKLEIVFFLKNSFMYSTFCSSWRKAQPGAVCPIPRCCCHQILI